jgi:uncharacterized cupin superfamily protein
MSGYAFSSVDELGEGFGFRKVRSALGVTAFGVNAIVYPPGYVGFKHWHDQQDELYFVHRGRARVEVGDEVRELGEGASSTSSRRPHGSCQCGETEDLVLLVVGGKGGYVERDGHLVDVERDLPRRQSFGS